MLVSKLERPTIIEEKDAYGEAHKKRLNEQGVVHQFLDPNGHRIELRPEWH
jgi:hypothetical protein